MFRKLLVLGVMISGLLVASPSSSAAPRVIVRSGIVIGPRYYRPYYPAYGFYPYYRPYYYGPPVYAVRPNTGELKLDNVEKDAQVFVDGGYLGLAKKFKKFDLKPGTHDIELKDARGTTFLQEKVHIVAGKTTEIRG